MTDTRTTETRSPYLERAIAAAALAKKGKTRIEVKEALGLQYAHEAQTLINVGNEHARRNELSLTADELALLVSVAEWERRELARGQTCSPKLKYVGPWHWRGAKAARVARKRLDTHRAHEDRTKPWPATGLALIDAYHGGYVRLRPAGWALIHALESARATGGAA